MTDNTHRTTHPVIHEEPVYGSSPGHEQESKNLVQWGPIIAGVATTVAAMLVFTVLGLALGASVLEPREAGEDLGLWAGVYGAVTALLSFFLGGFVAARSASVFGGGAAVLNGFLVAAAMMILVLYMIGTGLGGLFGTFGSNIGDIANLAQDQGVTQDVSQQDVEQAVDDATDELATVADDAFNAAENAAWGTLIGILLVHLASAIGGMVGSNSRGDIRRRAPDGPVT